MSCNTWHLSSPCMCVCVYIVCLFVRRVCVCCANVIMLCSKLKPSKPVTFTYVGEIWESNCIWNVPYAVMQQNVPCDMRHVLHHSQSSCRRSLGWHAKCLHVWMCTPFWSPPQRHAKTYISCADTVYSLPPISRYTKHAEHTI
jgi:hypothetical protein